MQLSGDINIVQVLLAIVAFFMVRTLNKVDRNQALLFGRLEKVEGRLNRLLGAHDVNHKGKEGADDEI